MKIKDMSPDQRPYERAEKAGVENLSDTELLAIILRTGTKGKSSVELSQEVLSIDKGRNGLLNFAACSYDDFRKLSGLGHVKALELSCVTELSKRISSAKIERKTVLRTAAEIAQYYMEHLRNLDYEEVHVMLFDGRHRFIKSRMLARGCFSYAGITPREILRYALENSAAEFVLVHNHPSGNTLPSADDLTFVKLLSEAGRVMNVTLRDSVIIGQNGYLSLSEKGMI